VGERGVCACAHIPMRAQRQLGSAPSMAQRGAGMGQCGAGPSGRWARVEKWAHAQTPR